MTAGWGAGRRVLVATAIAGTLDIAAAVILTLIYHGVPIKMLRRIGSGLIPDAASWSLHAGAALGLATHYAIMAVMAAVFVFAADRNPALKRDALLWGLLYGIGTWAVMNLAVLPLRFGNFPSSAIGIATALFCHIALVGIPIALVARR
jgi:hypothetical protein